MSWTDSRSDANDCGKDWLQFSVEKIWGFGGINLNHCKSHSRPGWVYSLKRSVENVHVKLCFSVHGSTDTRTRFNPAQWGSPSGDCTASKTESPLADLLSHTHTPPSMGLYVRSQAVCVQRSALIRSWRVLTGQISKCVRVSPPAGERARMNSYTALGIGSRQLELLIYRCGPERERWRDRQTGAKRDI